MTGLSRARFRSRRWFRRRRRPFFDPGRRSFGYVGVFGRGFGCVVGGAERRRQGFEESESGMRRFAAGYGECRQQVRWQLERRSRTSSNRITVRPLAKEQLPKLQLSLYRNRTPAPEPNHETNCRQPRVQAVEPPLTGTPQAHLTPLDCAGASDSDQGLLAATYSTPAAPSQATGAPPHPLTTAVPTPPRRRISPTPELRQRHSLQKTEGRLQGPNHRGQATTSPNQSHLKQQAAGLHTREKERESHPPTVLSQSAESTTYSQRRGRPASGTRQAVAATAGPASPTPEEVKSIEREAAKVRNIDEKLTGNMRVSCTSFVVC
ncbi:NAD(P)-binding Rossmann-fold superfamily protein [Striga asiatica]|uniref:NAD(P)-binding Rossmann-fold superfamily protein n=1 Tax=Striga asiatica TaxID=4170 RepID=A0A5A7PX67_STRAF|nr:NAD(P)-binding Rossmann-fold superfamily protein [Striga asiatica]